jgi:uncharacterized membrane protein
VDVSRGDPLVQIYIIVKQKASIFYNWVRGYEFMGYGLNIKELGLGVIG